MCRLLKKTTLRREDSLSRISSTKHLSDVSIGLVSFVTQRKVRVK